MGLLGLTGVPDRPHGLGTRPLEVDDVRFVRKLQQPIEVPAEGSFLGPRHLELPVNHFAATLGAQLHPGGVASDFTTVDTNPVAVQVPLDGEPFLQ
jgi:hypothetical protein